MTNAHTFKILCPLTGQEKEIRVEPSYYDRLLVYLPNQFLNLTVAYEVLRNPYRIFSGVKRSVSEGDEKLCYVGKPKAWFIRDQKKVPFPGDKLVFVVFLNGRGSIYEFGAEKADYEDSFSPIDWKNRFGELKWKKTS